MLYKMLSENVFARWSGAPERFCDALDHLKGLDGSCTAMLTRVPRERGMTVLFKLEGFGALKVGRQVPSRDPHDDIAEIQRVLGERCRLLPQHGLLPVW